MYELNVEIQANSRRFTFTTPSGTTDKRRAVSNLLTARLLSVGTLVCGEGGDGMCPDGRLAVRARGICGD